MYQHSIEAQPVQGGYIARYQSQSNHSSDKNSLINFDDMTGHYWHTVAINSQPLIYATAKEALMGAADSLLSCINNTYTDKEGAA